MNENVNPFTAAIINSQNIKLQLIADCKYDAKILAEVL